MKNQARKAVALFVAFVLLLCAFSLAASAQEPESGTLKVMAYNVSGLPVVGSAQGSKKTGGSEKAKILGQNLNLLDVDILGVQEDFNYHKHLAAEMTAFPNQTFTSGGVPLGDGLNIFSKSPIYNVERTTWNRRWGILSGASDELTKKGFLHTLVELTEGVYFDLYVLHADAGRDNGSIAARTDNYRQLAADINARPVDRAVIVMGDFNTAISRNLPDDIYGNLMQPAGLSDTWVELYNGGNYFYNDGEGWSPALEESIDKVLYKNGGGVTFTPETLDHFIVTDANGDTYTDHHATVAELSYTVIDPATTTETLVPPQPYDRGDMFSRYIKRIFVTLKLILSDIGNLPSILSDLF
ncbi:MAG: endonuclease/exonuclease/phosphatase family protein [Oscillospiraceae bacterium]|jgi:endonuclease/exonuclease/phosphatase family metal-dependent hydrolase|nr:endonuclease/exonuclease/phosphatase family protein [Oscillospiraceae bacterium]